MSVWPSVKMKCDKCGGTGHHVVVSGGALMKARLRLGLSLRAVADIVGISAPYLHDIEKNRRSSPDMRMEVAETLDQLASDSSTRME